MTTRFKNRDIVIRIIKLSWNGYYVPRTIKKYESGMSIEEIIQDDFVELSDYALKRFSQRYHAYISLSNIKKRGERKHETVQK